MSTALYITGQCSISRQRISSNGKDIFQLEEEDPAAFFTAAYRDLGVNYPKFHKMDNLCKMGWLATEYMLKANPVAGRYAPASTGIVLANSNASMDTDLKYYESTRDIASPALFVYTLPNIVIGEICIRHGFKGENAFFVQETFDAVFLEDYVRNLMNNNILQCCICGWVEILATEYKTVLFLVEKIAGNENTPAFTADNINKTYQLANG